MKAPASTVEYVRVSAAEDEVPRLDGPPFVAIVVAEQRVPDIWRWEAARRLVASGCRFMLAWGEDASAWDDAVDDAALEAFDYDEVPADQAVMTTWHDDEDLDEVFWFARHRAAHPALQLNRTVILHVSAQSKEETLRALYDET